MGVLDMFTENLVTRLRLIVYAVLVFFSFFIFVGVAVLKDKWFGQCILYFDGGYIAPPVSNCNYPMAIAIMLQLIYTLFRIVSLLLLVLGKFTPEMFLFSNILELVYVLIDIAATILTFIGACILSAGYNAAKKYIGDAALSAVNVAQAGSWISTFLWLFVAAIGVVYMLRSGKLPFMRSGGAAGTTNTGPTASNAPPPDTLPNYDPPKY
uniref:MARVEL domain-containing protein n=1 Tax=Arion vulgaris TaxID=1028688 RepID=A0A0B7A400_9EUPU